MGTVLMKVRALKDSRCITTAQTANTWRCGSTEHLALWQHRTPGAVAVQNTWHWKSSFINMYQTSFIWSHKPERQKTPLGKNFSGTCRTDAGRQDDEVWTLDVLPAIPMAIASPIHAALDLCSHRDVLCAIQAVRHLRAALKKKKIWTGRGLKRH